MWNKLLIEKSIKKRSRIQTSIFEWFFVDFWIIFGAKIASKSVPKRFWKGFEVAIRLRMAFRVHLGVGSASKPRFHSKTSPIWEPKLVQNLSKIDQKSKNIDSKTNFEFDTIFWSIFDQILINLYSKMESNLDASLT